MMNVLHRLIVSWVLVVNGMAAATSAHAGRPCETRPAQSNDVVRGMTLAANTAARLDASGAQVVVLARAGQDLSKYGVSWSHFGFAYREGYGARSNWRVVH